MNGIAASKKIFNLIDIENPVVSTVDFKDYTITINNCNFAYDDKRVLNKIDIIIPQNSFTSIVGKSGCGKSTITSLLMKMNDNYEGSIKIGGKEIKELDRTNLYKKLTLISANSYIFKGTIRDNLLMAKEDANDEELWDVLIKVNLAEFLKERTA